MSTEGGRWSKKRKKLVYIVCEPPLVRSLFSQRAKKRGRKNLFEQPSFKWVPLSFATWWLLFG